MSQIKKQTIQGTFFAYLGIVIGFFTIALIQPKVLSENEIGLLRVITAYASLVLPFCNLGFTNAALRFFPYFRNPKKNHHGFLFLFIAITIFGSILGLSVLLLAQDFFINAKDAPLFNQYAWGIILYAISMAFFGVFDTYSRLLFDSVSGRFLKEFLTRAFILLVVLIFLFTKISFSQFFLLWLLANSVPTIILFLKLYKDGNINFRPDFSLLTPTFIKEISIVSFFAILSNSSSVIIQQIDGIMIAKYLNLSENGIFSVTMYFGIVIAMPLRTVYSIATTQVSENWKSNDVDNIYKMYKSSCLFLTVIGVLFFVGLWANIDNILQILPPSYSAGKYVIFFMGLGALIDMATGLNGIVLITSKYYKYDTYFIIALIVITIGLNLLLIPTLGIVGVAVAYCATFFIINFFRFYFVWRKFNMQPYDLAWLKVLAIGALSYVCVVFIPHIPAYITSSFPIEDIAIRSLGVSGVFVPLVLWLKISPQINGTANKLFDKIQSIFIR